MKNNIPNDQTQFKSNTILDLVIATGQTISQDRSQKSVADNDLRIIGRIHSYG